MPQPLRRSRRRHSQRGLAKGNVEQVATTRPPPRRRGDATPPPHLDIQPAACCEQADVSAYPLFNDLHHALDDRSTTRYDLRVLYGPVSGMGASKVLHTRGRSDLIPAKLGSQRRCLARRVWCTLGLPKDHAWVKSWLYGKIRGLRTLLHCGIACVARQPDRRLA